MMNLLKKTKLNKLLLALMLLLALFSFAACNEEEVDLALDVAGAVLDIIEDSAAQGNASGSNDAAELDPDGWYNDKDSVALYLYTYGELPGNYITKSEAEDLGWVNSKGNLADVAPGMSIGGDRFGNYEKLLPEKDGRKYYECDIDYVSGYRNDKRIVYSNDGLIYYTGNHYKSFEQLY